MQKSVQRLGGQVAGAFEVWLDGRELLLECIGILAEHRGAKLAEAMDDRYFKRVVFSSESTPFKWLSPFADLHDLIGAK